MRFDGIEMNGPLLGKTGANIASASTVDLETATGNSLTVTGTTTITSFGTVQSGAVFVLTFSGILTLTHNGTSLILPTGANIVTQAGDVAQFQSLGSGNWRCVSYTKADGSALVGAPSSLAATLGVGNTTGGNDIEVSNGDKIVFKKNTFPDLDATYDGAGLNLNRGFYLNFDDGAGNTGVFGVDRIIEFTGVFDGTTQQVSIGNPGGNSGGFQFSTSDGVDTQNIVLRPDGFEAPLNYQPSQSFSQPYQIVNKEYVDAKPIPNYTPISKIDWDALVLASGLVPGTFYRVTAAYTFDFYGAKDIIVLADSVNTVQSTGWVVFADYFVPYQVDVSLSHPGLFYDCIPQMSLDPDAIYDYITGSPNWRFNTGLFIFLTAADTFLYQAQVNGVDPSIVVFTNTKAIDGPNLGQLGTYTPETAPAAADDFFTPYETLIKQAISVSSAEIQSGKAIDLVQFPAVADSFWNIIVSDIEYSAGSVQSTEAIFVIADGLTDDQWLFNLNVASDTITEMTNRRATGTSFAKNAKIQLQFSAGSGPSVDSTFKLYLTGILKTTI